MVVVSWDVPPDAANGQRKEAWFSYDSYLTELSLLTSTGVPDQEHERFASENYLRESGREFDRAYYRRLVSTVVRGAALFGMVSGGGVGLVLGWMYGPEPIGYLILAGGGMVVGGVLGRHVMAFLAYSIMRLILSRYRETFRRNYGEDL
jgi:hypothetical protein